MVKGMQSQATMVVASATETNSGEWEDHPTIYHVLSKDFALVSTKKSNPRVVAGQPFPVLPWRGMEETGAQLGLLPVLENNGLGEAFARFFGSDDIDLYGEEFAYIHALKWEDICKTATYFISYGGGRYEKIRMMAIDSLNIEAKNTGELAIDGVLKGAELVDSNISEYGAEDLMDLATAKQLTGMGARLEYGQIGAAVREAFESVKIELKRNITMSLPGKDGQHPAGSGAPRACSSKSSDCKLTIDFQDTNGEELKRWREGINTTPTATAQNDSSGLVKARLSIFGPPIEVCIDGEDDIMNTGLDTPIFSGTYDGGDDVVTVGEIMLAAGTVYEMAQGTNKDLAFRGLQPEVTVAIVAGEDVATCTIGVVSKAITINVKTTGTSPISTAAEILQALLAKPEAMALVEVGLKNGQTGVGIPAAFSAVNLTTSGKDGFKFRTTTGGPWSAWSSWMAITKSAQELVSGIEITFSEDDQGVDGDYWYFCSHVREAMRFTIPNLNIGVFTDKIADGVYKGHIEATHTSADPDYRPTCDIICTDALAYV
jgi:hypothetical protein